MGRIQTAYEAKFRTLLGQVGARRLEQGVEWFSKQARHLSHEERIPLPFAFARLYERTLKQTERYQSRSDPHPPHPASLSSDPPRFLCDVGLGGLARWLRGAGYEAHWTQGIDDSELIQEAGRLSAILLTTDSIMMERRVLRDGVVPALWVSPSLTMVEQLTQVLGELRLPLRESRCMTCGGELRRVEKEALRDRIPPRTYQWLDEFFVCERCDKLFWHGTHWQNIRQRLQKIGG